MYKCSDCGYSAEEDGSCPMCNVPMEEAENEKKAVEYIDEDEEE